MNEMAKPPLRSEPHPINGAVYTAIGDGLVRVEDKAKDKYGLFRWDGTWIEGELTYASEEAAMESFHQTADFMREYLRTLIGDEVEQFSDAELNEQSHPTSGSPVTRNRCCATSTRSMPGSWGWVRASEILPPLPSRERIRRLESEAN